MNKKKVGLLTLVMVLTLSLLVACGGGGSKDNAIVGTWKISQVESGGEFVDLEEFEAQTGINFDITFDFKTNGKVSMDMMGQKYDGEYKLTGDKLVIDGVEVDYTGDKITIEESGTKMVLVKK